MGREKSPAVMQVLKQSWPASWGNGHSDSSRVGQRESGFHTVLPITDEMWLALEGCVTLTETALCS